MSGALSLLYLLGIAVVIFNATAKRGKRNPKSRAPQRSPQRDKKLSHPESQQLKSSIKKRRSQKKSKKALPQAGEGKQKAQPLSTVEAAQLLREQDQEYALEAEGGFFQEVLEEEVAQEEAAGENPWSSAIREGLIMDVILSRPKVHERERGRRR
ncbi:MAG: hypothetical protein Q4E76_04410 [Tissierellia bacterium]|nr:hypothetical protein [Tissierellia bacterium]